MVSYREGKELQDYIINRLTENITDKTYYNRNEFTGHIASILDLVKDNKTLIKGIVLALSEDAGLGYIIIEDPDGNPILIDQHR